MLKYRAKFWRCHPSIFVFPSPVYVRLSVIGLCWFPSFISAGAGHGSNVDAEDERARAKTETKRRQAPAVSSSNNGVLSGGLAGSRAVDGGKSNNSLSVAGEAQSVSAELTECWLSNFKYAYVSRVD